MDNEAVSTTDQTELKLKAEDRRAQISFDSISKGQSEVFIEYEKQLYCLRVTKNGKLILNK